MKQEAALGMLEKLGTLRKLLEEHAHEMQQLKMENEWLKMVLKNCEGKRVDTKGKSVVGQDAELIKLQAEVQELRKDRDELADMLAQRIRAYALIEGTRPRPCVKFKLNPISSWIAKLMEETAEVVHVAAEWAEMDDGDAMESDDGIASPEELGEELTDVITVCTSWLDALGYDEEARAKIQGKVNDKNRRRGYW